MSVVIPAYNEEDQLVGMLEETVNYLEYEYGMIVTDAPKSEAQKEATPLRQRDHGQANGHACKTIVTFPTANLNRGWVILLVDDGSTDSTLETALILALTPQPRSRPRRLSGPRTHRAEHAVNIPAGSIRVVSLVKNRGKGGAVICGMRHVRGKYIVFVDAHAANKFDDLGKLFKACEEFEDAYGRDVAVGSRAHLVGSEAVVK